MNLVMRFPFRRSLLVGLGLVACLGATTSRAQGLMTSMSNDRLLSFALGGGVSVPVSDAKDAFKNGFNGQGFVRLNLHQLPISPRLDFTFQNFDLKGAKIASPAGGGTSTSAVTGTGKVLAGVANVQVPLMKGPIQPYVLVGVGAYYLSTDVDGGSSTS